jgi:chromate reductase
MRFLAISGSARGVSTNTAMLSAVSAIARPDHEVIVFSRLSELPVFSPDAEKGSLPQPVRILAELIADSSGLIVSSPEYVRSVPGGLKNAIDWLVSREELIGKPIALMHASHRGEDMLAQLRLILSTVSDRFTPEVFLNFNLMKLAPEEISQELMKVPNREKISAFLRTFANHCA